MNDNLKTLRHFDFSSLVLGSGPARYLIVAALPLIFYLLSMWAMQSQINQMQQQLMQPMMQPMMQPQGFQQQQPGF